MSGSPAIERAQRPIQIPPVGPARRGAVRPSRRQAGYLALFEPEPNADDDRERQSCAVVIEAVEARADELIDLRESADATQPELRVEIQLAGNRDQHAGADAPGERGGSIVEVRDVRDR